MTPSPDRRRRFVRTWRFGSTRWQPPSTTPTRPCRIPAGAPATSSLRPSSAWPSGSCSGPGALSGTARSLRLSRSPRRCRDLGYAVWLIPAVLAPLDHPQARRGALRRDGRRRPVGLPGHRGAPTPCCPGSSRASRPRSCSGSPCTACGRSRSSRSPRVASAAAAWIHDWVLYYPDARSDDPGDPPRLHGDLGGGHRGRRLGGAPSGAQARRRARRIPRLTGADRRAGAGGPQPLDQPSRCRPGWRSTGSVRAAGRATCSCVGPSGSGKSTLALAIGGMIPREIPAAMGGLSSLDGREIRASSRPRWQRGSGWSGRTPTASS